MTYQKIKKDNYHIHIIDNKKFHNIVFAIYFTQNINEEDFAYHNVLVDILTTACKKYDTRSKIVKRTQDLYSINPYATTFRCGNLLVTKFAISILNSKYLEKNIVKDNILLIKELLLNPLIKDNKFNDKYFELAINDEMKKTERLKERLITYANYQAIKKSSNDNENYQISKYITLDKLRNISNEELYQKYLEMFNKSKIDFFLAGNINNSNELVEFIKKEFKFNNQYQLNNTFITHLNKPQEIKELKEKMNIEQSKLSVIIKAYDVNDYEMKNVSVIYNSLLGGDSNSFLNTVVREENGFAYSMYSFYNKPDNMIIINGGFSQNNYQKIMDIIHKSMSLIEQGKFTKKKLEISKKNLINDLLNYNESNNSLVNFYFGIEIFHGKDVKERIEDVKKITKEDIIKYAKKIKITTIYNLESDL